MVPVEYSIREPVGRAWLCLAGGFVTAAELFFERHREQTAVFFNTRFTDGEVLALMAPFVALALFGLAWLVRLYTRPGHVRIDAAAGTLTRVRYALFRPKATAAPLASWKVRAHFFGPAELDRGQWKRLVLSGPIPDEVILWTDVARGDELLAALRAQRAVLVYEESVAA